MAQQGARRRSVRTRVLGLVAALGVGAVLGGGTVWLLGSPPPSVLTVALDAGSGFDAEGTMKLHTTDNGVMIELALDDLAPLAEGQVYEAWLASDGPSPLSVGTFRPDARGSAEVTLWAAGPVERYESVWVTLEPDFTDPAHDGPTVVEALLP